MKWTPILFILFYTTAQSQVDTLTNAKAFRTNFVIGNIYGTTTNGHIYGVAFTLNYDVNGGSLPVTIHRMDLTDHTVQSKTVGNVLSAPYMFWRFCFDSSGSIYTGFNSTREVWKINMKDSIYLKNYGNSSTPGDGLAYVLQLGRDRNVYIGNSSSATSTDWAMIDVVNDTMIKHPEVDEFNGYVITISGDTSWVYVQTGQNPFRYFAVRKSDNYKKILFTQTSGFFNAGVHKNGCYVQSTSATYRMQDTTATSVPPAPVGTGIVEYREVNVDYVQQAGLPLIANTFFDQVKSKFFWTLNGVADSISVTSSYTQTPIRIVFNDYANYNRMYYVGDYYGNYYDYNMETGERTVLGNTGLNIFSTLQYNDSIYYMASYPSGALTMWNKNQQWTAETVINGVLTHTGANTNPKLICYWRTQTTAGFHEPQKIVRMANGIIGGGGNVIRTDNTCSIAFYDPRNGQYWGFNQDSINRLSFVDIAAWGNKMILSTGNSYGGTPKLFIYDTQLRTMTDSLDLGADFSQGYGYIFTTGDLLLGIKGDGTFYKVNLSTKQLTYIKKAGGTVNQVQLLPDGYFGANTSGLIWPSTFSTVKSKPGTPYTYDGVGGCCYLYNNQGVSYQILHRHGIIGTPIDLNTGAGIQKYLREWLK